MTLSPRDEAPPDTLPVAADAARGPADLTGLLAGKRLPTLDGFRAVGLFFVILYHFGVNAPGGLSVTMFFVLSGFLITWLLLKEQGATGGVSLRIFYARRTLRIFPAYYAFVIASIVLDYVLGDPWTRDQATVALTYTLNYFNALNGHNATPAPHVWSLAVEEQFYLVWPLAFVLLARRAGRRTLVLGLAAAMVVGLGWRSLAYIGFGFPHHYIHNAFDTRFDSLAIGCLMAVVSVHPVFLDFARAVAARPWYPLFTLGLLTASRMGGSDAYGYSLGYTVDSLLLAVLVLQMMQLHRSLAWRWLEWRPVRYLGTISYPVYLWHSWALGAGNKVLMVPPAGRFVIAFALAVAAGTASYYLIEQPMLSLRPRLEAFLRARGPLFPRRARPAISVERV
jgi:peptidoglycan/LPS O-acetylase OafA/YrhL